MTKLQRIQNFALRTVLNLHPRCHVSQHYKDLHWLTVNQRIHFKILTTTFKCIHCLAPSPLATKVVLSSPLDMLLDTSQFYPISAIGKKAFSYSAPRCWNALPRNLRIIPSLDTFKSHVKHHLFTNFSSYLHSVNPYTWQLSFSFFSFLFSPFAVCLRYLRLLFVVLCSLAHYKFYPTTLFPFLFLCFSQSHILIPLPLYLFFHLDLNSPCWRLVSNCPKFLTVWHVNLFNSFIHSFKVFTFT